MNCSTLQNQQTEPFTITFRLQTGIELHIGMTSFVDPSMRHKTPDSLTFLFNVIRPK